MRQYLVNFSSISRQFLVNFSSISRQFLELEFRVKIGARASIIQNGHKIDAVRPLAVYLVNLAYRQVARPAGVPIIGMGGIQYWQDAVEFLLAGASGLAVGTALFVDPAACVKIAQGVGDYLTQQGYRSIREIIGTVQLPNDPSCTTYP